MDDDDLDGLLRPTASASSSPLLRPSLLGQTTRELRSRRRLRRIGMWLGMAACYVAGLATMRLLSPGQTTVGPVASVQQTGPLEESTAEEATRPDHAAIANEVELPASVLERLAEAVSGDDYREFYRRAGDRHMKETGDLAAALRCYRRALDAASPDELVISDNDNWLIMTLKQARREELPHARNGS
jgi:hypothetical protein